MTLQFHPGRKKSGLSVITSPSPAEAPAATLAPPAAPAEEMAPQASDRPIAERLESIRQGIVEAVAAGQLELADRFSLEAVELAKRHGAQADIDLTQCNRAHILIALGRGQEVVSPLRKMLLSSSEPGSRFAASYAIALHHFMAREDERSLFYARQALRYAEDQSEADLLAKSNNLIGNLQLRESYFAEACVSYEEALKYLPAGQFGERAGILANFGYCLAVVGKISLAFRHLVASLRTMNHCHAGGWKRFPHLGLAFAYLEIGRHQRSIQHSLKALELSEATPGAEEQVKNSLYLLGETKKICGRDTEAYECFVDLQKRFYPDQPFIVDVLMAADVRKLINLMA
jgi:tetratricopeptide (TPR) repeat protein